MNVVAYILPMESPQKRLKWVGSFIRKKREDLGLSQRDLASQFVPAVTTKFISNIERGVTPLPVSHLATLTRVLKIPQGELASLLQRDYQTKLATTLGMENGAAGFSTETLSNEDQDFLFAFARSFAGADAAKRRELREQIERTLGATTTTTSTSGSST